MSGLSKPDTLEREADAQRASLNRTLDAVEQRFSPNQLVQQAVDYFGENGGDLAQSVGRSVKANPLPLILTGVGLAWLMSSQGKSASYNRNSFQPGSVGGVETDSGHTSYPRINRPLSAASIASGAYSDRYNARQYSAYNTTSDGDGDEESMLDGAKQAGQSFMHSVSQWRDDLQDKLRSVKQDTGESVDQWRERVISTSVQQAEGLDNQYRQLTHSASRWRDDLQEQLQSVKQEAGETAEQWKARVVNTSTQHADNLGHQYRQTRQQTMIKGREHVQATRNWMHEQPLVAGALGVAVGALIGSLLPPSRVEDKLVGDHADSIKASLTQEAASVSENAASAIEGTAQSLRAKGEEQLGHVEKNQADSTSA